MRKYIPIIPIITLILIPACSKKSTEPKINLKLKITPYERIIAIDETATFSMEIENVVDLFGFSAEIIFDSTKIELPENSVTKGEMWNGETLLHKENEPDRLNIMIGIKQTEGYDGINGNGILFDFKLKGINAGESQITIEALQLIDEHGIPISGFQDIEIFDSKLIIE